MVMKEERDREETVPIEGEKRPSRRSRSRDAFKQRQRELAQENKEQRRKVQEGGAEQENEEQEKAQQEKTQQKKIHLPKKAAAAALILAAAVLAGLYGYKSLGYRNTYMPHTVINGVDASGKTAQEVKDLISSGVKDYSLTLRLREEKQEVITGESIGLHTVYDGSLEEIIRQQNPYAWPRYLIKGPSYDIQTMIAYDEGSLDEVMDGLECFDDSKAVAPSDAYLSDYIEGQGYTIVPETEGSTLDKDKVKAEAARAVSDLTGELDLDELGCYAVPAVRRDDSSLTAARDARNRYVSVTVTYTFGSGTEVLDGTQIHQWLVVDGANVSLDPDKPAEYVKGLASRHNTAYTKRSFATSYGQSVEVAGFYGWRINQTEETKALLEILEAGESVTREPVYSQTAASHDGPDYGSTYAEVNLTAQHLFFYKDGEKVLESDFVSGNISRGHSTPPGIFSITYKQKDAVLKGEGYASPVKFWMPFNGGIGFHDASWRSSFGGSIFRSSGSHGCVNMPYDAAKQLYEYVYKGMPVICYELPGTENKKSSQSSGKAPQATAAPTQPVPAETPPAQVPQNPAENPAETLPVQTAPQQTEPQPSQPEVIIQPADPTTAAQESQPAAGTTDGYGPAFQTLPTGGEPGPGTD